MFNSIDLVKMEMYINQLMLCNLDLTNFLILSSKIFHDNLINKSSLKISHVHGMSFSKPTGITKMESLILYKHMFEKDGVNQLVKSFVCHIKRLQFLYHSQTV